MQWHSIDTEKLIRRYERYVAPFTFTFGFLLDAFTLNRIDLWIDHLVLLGYLSCAGGAIAIYNLYESGRMRVRFMERGIAFVPVVMQFGFGGLLSAFVLFYAKSAALSRSWLFLLIFAVLLIGNERFRARYQRVVFQVSIYFTALFSYSIFLLPLVLKKIGPTIFLLSGVLSLVLVALFVLFLYLLAPRQIAQSKQTLAYSIGSIFLLFNILYFTNIIPPIPLALKESGIYHSVARTEEGAYALRFEVAPWYSIFRETSAVYHGKFGEPVYYFTSIFAPTKFNTPIFHQWSYYDEQERTWVRTERIKFSIVGGRDGGYRGYSYKTGIQPGYWRVEVVTEQGQVLGRESFRVIRSMQEPVLEFVLR